MNKAELVKAVAERSGASEGTVSDVLGAFEDVVVKSVAGGDKVALPGFLSFESSERAERQGRNPATGESMTIPAATVPKVKIGKSFKDAVKG